MLRWFWPRERWRRLYHLSGVAQFASLGVVLVLPSVFGVDGLVTVVLLFAVMLLGPGWWLYRQAVIEFIEQLPELPEGSGPEWPPIEGRLSVGEKAMLREVGFLPVIGGLLRWLGRRVRASLAWLVARAGPREFRD